MTNIKNKNEDQACRLFFLKNGNNSGKNILIFPYRIHDEY